MKLQQDVGVATNSADGRSVAVFFVHVVRLAGLGAVLFQCSRGDWRPVVYASCSRTDTEQRCVQIKKEGLAVTWACDKFSETTS